MIVDDVRTSSKHQLASVLHTLKHVHGIDLKLDESSSEEIELLRDSSEIIKNSIVSEGAFNSWHNNPSYAKHMLILEATRLYLSEIAPKRRPRALKEGAEVRLDEDRADAVGRWMMDFSGKHKAKDDKTLAMLNSFSRVGEDLTTIGEPFGPKNIGELMHSYKARAEDEAGEDFDRRQARENLHALKLGFSMYAKHAKPEEGMVAEEGNVSEEDVGEGDAFQAARLKAIKDGGRDGDKFMVGDKEFTLSNVGQEDIARAREIDEMASLIGKALTEDHMQSHDYQASMARAELYRNAKYGMDMLRMIRPEDDVEPWIAACLTKSAMQLDKIFHYLDYYLKFEPDALGMRPAQARPAMPMDEDVDDSTGTTARQNLMMIVEYSIKLFHMIQPGDKLEGWVAMMLTKASEGVSSAKHWLEYKQFEKHAGNQMGLAESAGLGESTPTRKNFRMVADLIKAHPDAEARHHLASHHAEIFAKGNPRFDRSKFFSAANASQVTPKKHHGSKMAESALMEDAEDLAQAETLIAAKSLSDELQNMAEKVAKMGVEDLMPLVDTMKEQFGPEAAEGYNDIMKASLDSLLKSTQEAKEKSDDAVTALQGGGVPATPSDIEQVGAAAGAEAGDATVGAELPPPEGTGTMPAAAGGAEPLGRRKKLPPGEEEVTEAWDAKMHTAEKDKGKWDRWTIERLKAAKKKLMDKPSRDAKEQKRVKQLDFAIRAKQKDKWGKVDESAVSEGALSGAAKLIAALGLSGAAIASWLFGNQSANDTPLGKALAAAAAKGDQNAAKELNNLSAYIEAGDWNKIDMLKDTYLNVKTAAPQPQRPQQPMVAPGKTSLPPGVTAVKEESSTTRDDRAEKAGKKVTKDIEYDEKKKDGIHGAKRGKEDAKAEKAGKKVTKDIEYDEKVSEAKKSKPDFLDVDGDGDKKEPMKKALKDKKSKKVDESELEEMPSPRSMSRAGRAWADKKKSEDHRRHGFVKTYADTTDAISKTAARDEIEKGIDAFQKAGGKVTKVTVSKGKKGVKEAKKAKSAYAVGMAKAKEEAGLGSKPAHDLPKKVIKRAHEIARGIEKTDEQLAKLGTMLENAEISRRRLANALNEHRRAWKRMVSEGAQKDVLGVGQGFEGDMMQRRIAEVDGMISNIKGKITAIEEAGEHAMAQVIDQEKRAYRFQQAKAKAPWGVMFESKGKRDYKFFEDKRARDYWVQLNADMDVSLIDPSHFDMVTDA